MPRRAPTSERFDTSKVQGEDSFIILKKLTLGDIEKITEKGRRQKASRSEVGRLILIARIEDWNWADENGTPLPLPRDNPKVLEGLTEDEALFIANLTKESVTDDDLKN